MMEIVIFIILVDGLSWMYFWHYWKVPLENGFSQLLQNNLGLTAELIQLAELDSNLRR